MLSWSTVEFGKYKGRNKSLPQIVLSDPDWFFWAIEQNAFAKYKALGHEAQDVARKARNIRIPSRYGTNKEVEYTIHGPTGKAGSFKIVEASSPPHVGSTTTFRKSVIDLAVAREIKSYDKLGNKISLDSMKKIVFPDVKRLTKKRCKEFFSDNNNFY